jgi:uncharacterized Zn finger protein
MPCPTCGGTFVHVTTSIGAPVFYCRTCGTLQHSKLVLMVPELVERCRAFEAEVVGTPHGRETVEGDDTVASEWSRLGIRECISPPSGG